MLEDRIQAYQTVIQDILTISKCYQQRNLPDEKIRRQTLNEVLHRVMGFQVAAENEQAKTTSEFKRIKLLQIDGYRRAMADVDNIAALYRKTGSHIRNYLARRLEEMWKYYKEMK